MKPSCKSCKNVTCFIRSCFVNSQLISISEKKNLKQYKAGEKLYGEGDTAECVYIVYDGCLEIIKKDSNGGNRELYVATPGNLLGYLSVISNKNHTTSALAYGNSSVCVIGKDDFLNSFSENKELEVSFMKFIAGQIGMREKRLELIEKYLKNGINKKEN